MTIVADASAVASFLIPDEIDAFSAIAQARCRADTVHVPAHWPVELANIFWKAQRRKRIAAHDLGAIVRTAETFHSLVVIERENDIDLLIHMALQSGLTAYDTSYFLLAQRLQAPLLTRDVQLVRVAAGAGIEVIAP